MRKIETIVVLGLALSAAPGFSSAQPALEQLKQAAGTQELPAVAPRAAKEANRAVGVKPLAADSGVALLQRLLQGYKALEGRSIVEPGDPFYEDAILLQRLNGKKLQVEGQLEIEIGEPKILGRRTAVLYVRELAGVRRAPLLLHASYWRWSLEKWAAGFPQDRPVKVSLTVSYNYRPVDNWPFVVESVEPTESGAGPLRPVRNLLEGAVAELAEAAALGRSLEASAARELARGPGSEMAKEWSVSSGKIAVELEAERAKVLEAARSSDAALSREIEIAESLLAPAKRYLSGARRYLDLLEESRSRPLPEDLRESAERDLEEFRGHLRRLRRLG